MRTSTLRVALAASLLGTTLLSPRLARAQFGGLLPAESYVGWNVCFTSAMGTCTELWVASQPSTNPRFTQASAFVRHHSANSIASGLMSFAFHFTNPGGVGNHAAGATVFARQGAPSPSQFPQVWSIRSQRTPTALDDPSQNYLFLTSRLTPGVSTFIGGCDGGQFDNDHTSPFTTCGGGAYEIRSFTTLAFGSANIAGLSLDIYAGDNNVDGLPDQASCYIDFRSGMSGVGIDLGDPSTVASCNATPLTVVPEPSTVVLLAAPLLIGLVILRRRQP
jgi:hypothetical protein